MSHEGTEVILGPQACNPSYSGGWCREIKFQALLGRRVRSRKAWEI